MSNFRVNTNISLLNFSDEESLKCKIKQIAFECQKKIEHFSFDGEEFRFYIANYLKPYIYYNPIYWYTNPLIKLVKKHIGNEIPMCFLNELNDVEIDINFQEALKIVKKRAEFILLNGEDINAQEAMELLDLSEIIKDFYPDLVINYLMGKIVEGKLKLESDDYKRVFNRFMQLFKERNGLSCYFSVKKIPQDEVGKVTDAFIKIKNGIYHIIFNEERLCSEKVLENLRTVFHEVWHFVQKDERYSELYFRELFIMDLFLTKTKGEYGENNYEVMSDEADAFLNENILLYQYLARVSKKVWEQEKGEILSLIGNFGRMRDKLERFDQFGNKVWLDMYFDKIAKIYGINPYTDLGLIYSYDATGRRLRPLELFKKMEDLDKESEAYKYYKMLIFNANYSHKEMPDILRELKEEIDITCGNYRLLIEIYMTYVKKYLYGINIDFDEYFRERQEPVFRFANM